MFGLAIVIANLKILVLSFSYTIGLYFFVAGSMLIYIAAFVVADSLITLPTYNTFNK
jgi:hypothetical protein